MARTHDSEPTHDETTRPEPARDAAHARRYAASAGPTDDPAALGAELRREGDELVAGPGISVFTGPMWRGLLLGVLVGALVGVAIAVPLALVEFGGFGYWARFAVIAVVVGAGAATAGASYWGGRVPELSGESIDADNRPSSGSSLADPRTDDLGR